MVKTIVVIWVPFGVSGGAIAAGKYVPGLFGLADEKWKVGFGLHLCAAFVKGVVHDQFGAVKQKLPKQLLSVFAEP
jgi:hypothetical protein